MKWATQNLNLDMSIVANMIINSKFKAHMTSSVDLSLLWILLIFHATLIFLNVLVLIPNLIHFANIFPKKIAVSRQVFTYFSVKEYAAGIHHIICFRVKIREKQSEKKNIFIATKRFIYS